MPEDDYDLAGFSVGVVDKKKIIDGSRLEAGDVLLGVKSSGVHSNGFSLVRKVFGIGADDQADKEILSHYYDELGATLGETLLTPTRIYVKPVLACHPGRGHQGHLPHHRRRLLREHPPHAQGGPHRQDRKGRRAGAAHLRA